MRTFRDYRAAMASGAEPVYERAALPSDAVEFQGERAGFVSRAVAAIIDVAIIVLVVFVTLAVLWVLSFIINPTDLTAAARAERRIPPVLVMLIFGYCLNVLYWTAFWATSGRTIGNLVMGLRVINRKGRHPGWTLAFIRALFCTLFPIGLAWSIVSGANRSVQDVVLRTSVTYDWVVGIPLLNATGRITRLGERAS